MAWTAPRTWVAGEVVTAAMMNTHVRDNLNILKTSIADDGTIRAPRQLAQRQTNVNSAGAVDLVTTTYALAAATYMAQDGDHIIMESWYGVVASTWSGKHKFGGVTIGENVDNGYGGGAVLRIYMKTVITRTGALAQRSFGEQHYYITGSGSTVVARLIGQNPLDTVVPMTGNITVESTVNDAGSSLVEYAFRLSWVPAV